MYGFMHKKIYLGVHARRYVLMFACTRFGLTINISKTKVMYTAPTGETYVDPDIYFYGSRIDVVKRFVYLGSTSTNDGFLDAEMERRISKASAALGKIEKRVWTNKDLTINTKLAVYKTCVLTTLLYAGETWTPYRAQLKLPPTISAHQMEKLYSKH